MDIHETVMGRHQARLRWLCAGLSLLMLLPAGCEHGESTISSMSVSATSSLAASGDPSATQAPTAATPTSATTGSTADPTQTTVSNPPKPTATPLGERPPVGPPLKVRVTNADLLAEADVDSPIVGQLAWLTLVQPLGSADAAGLLPVRLADGRAGYCLRSQLADQNATLYARFPEMTVLSAIPNRNDPPRKSQLADVRQAEPGICVSLAFASPRNFTGIQLYERDICLLQKATLAKLGKAQARFRQNGYSIKIYDAYRPYDVTVRLAEINSNATYLASPLTGSAHNRGVAVDMTVVDSHGIELEMPSLMHTMDARAGRNRLDMTPAARQNLAYVQDIMVKSGFVPYAAEWWHYTDIDGSRYPHLNISLAHVDMVAGSARTTAKAPPARDPRTTGFVNVPITLVPTPKPSPTPRAGATQKGGTTPQPSPTTAEN